MAAPAAPVAPLNDPDLGSGVAQLVALVPNSEALLPALAAHLGVSVLSRSSFSYLLVPGTTVELLSVPSNEVITKWRLLSLALLELQLGVAL